MDGMHRKKILIAGLGKSGMAAARLLSGQQADLYGYDDKSEEVFSPENRKILRELGVRCFLGQEPDFYEFDQVITSPGMALRTRVLEKARQAGAEIIGELELAYRNSRSPFVAITGTNGKTTTTALVGEMYRLSGIPFRVVGNIGIPVADQVLAADERTVMVTEVSSFQLETIVDFHPRVSAVLNITPDHLDRHGSLEEYLRVKFRIFENQREGDYCVFNMDDPLAAQSVQRDLKAKAVPFSARRELDFGVCVRGGRIFIAEGGSSGTEVCSVDDLKIPGAHNLENALAAVAVARFAGVPLSAIREALQTFAGVEHRIEFVAEVEGAAYINDSKGTNPASTARAIEAMKKPTILLLGGYDKHIGFDELFVAFTPIIKACVVLGDTQQQILDCAEKYGYRGLCQTAETFGEAVELARSLATEGDAVLLSPACASWDMFDNYEQRGQVFKDIVREF